VQPLRNREKHTKNNSRSSSKTERSAACGILLADSIELRPKGPHRQPALRLLRALKVKLQPDRAAAKVADEVRLAEVKPDVEPAGLQALKPQRREQQQRTINKTIPMSSSRVSLAVAAAA
jgi:hypothetical protein